MTRPDICIHHAPCQDGFTAAWAVWKRWGHDVEYVAGVHGATPPNVAGKHVLIVDFSYKRPMLEALARSAASITILDHHKTAEADLAAFVPPGGLVYPPILAKFSAMNPPIQARFDMTKSGAMLAWEYCHPGEPAPRLVEHVQDRDLWRFELDGTREICAALFSEAYGFALWDDYAEELETAEARALIVAEGAAIERKHHKDIEELLGQTMRYMVIGGQRVPVANLPYTMASDGANTLAEGNAFAACYFDRGDGYRQFSLRSKPEGADVSEIAAAYGGGGHARAAGFQVPLGWEGEGA